MLHGGNDNNTFFAVNASTGETIWTSLQPYALCPDSGHMRPCEVYSLPIEYNERKDSADAKITTVQDVSLE